MNTNEPNSTNIFFIDVAVAPSTLRVRVIRLIGDIRVKRFVCCESTARDAFFRDFRVFVIADSTAAGENELHLNSLKILAYAFAYVTTTDYITERFTIGSRRL